MNGLYWKRFAPCLLILSARSLFAADVLVPETSVESVEGRGTGCPEKTWFASFDKDRQRLHLEFWEFTTEIGRDISLAFSRRNCQAKVKLQDVVGWQYSVRNVRYSGYMEIDKGIRATHRVNLGFEGQQQEVSEVVTNGFFKGDYQFVTTSDPTLRAWSDCKNPQALVLMPQTRLARTIPNLPNAFGLITNDAIDAAIVFDFDLEWRRCPDVP